jgi:amino acid adenylation domain-containing protein/non-ribosomal peptide synthase protein (TIGR01720 family)
MTQAMTAAEKKQRLAQLLQQKLQQPRSQTFPLSFAQRRLWFLDQLQPGQTVYILAAALQVTGTLHIPALQQSLAELVQRHEILRSGFVQRNGQPVQQVLSQVSVPISVIDLQGIVHTESIVRSQVQSFVTQPFDLAQPPLLRVAVIQLSDRESVLMLALHHIIADYWSMRLFLKELTTLYQCRLQSQSAPLPKLTIQYADYATWQQKWLQTDARSRQLDYWKQQLADLTPLQLPTDFPRPPLQTFHGATQAFHLSTELSTALKQLSREADTTLFMTLLAAFQVLLSRYTGQADIAVGSTISQRNRPEIEPLIGLFVNNLVLRSTVREQQSFREFLHQVRDMTLAAYAHQDLPFEDLVEQISGDRDLSQNPLFQVMFVLHNTPSTRIQLPNLTLQPLQPEQSTSRFDLSLDMDEAETGLTGVFEYRTDLFTTATIARLIDHFQTLLTGIVEDPNGAIAELPLLTPSEQHQFRQWNDTAQDLEIIDLIDQLEQQVTHSPTQIAVTFDHQGASHICSPHPKSLSQSGRGTLNPELPFHLFGRKGWGMRANLQNGDTLDHQSLTYHQLNHCANQLAHYLLPHVLEPETRIGICLERSPEMLIALLAVLKTGAAYVPLDPSYPRDRLAFMLQDAAVSLVITQSDQLHHLPDDSPSLCLDQQAEAIAQQSGENLKRAIAADQLAYVIYTSGSTGTPKGVQVLHRGLANLLGEFQARLEMSSHDRWLAVTTIAFDIAALELFLPLISGAQVIIASPTVASDADQLSQALTTHDITRMQATPATWRMLLAAGWQGKSDLHILSGGEALDRPLAAQLLTKGCALWNLYGPTETTIWSAAHRVESVERAIVPIGYPIANTQFYVLDQAFQPVPVGVPGELYIGGLGVARGYWQRSDLTAERFVPHPKSLSPGRGTLKEISNLPSPCGRGAGGEGRLYQTGDLVRYLPDSTLEYLGRLDNQVKLRGYRIELGEIERCLQQHPEVSQAAVVLHQDSPEQARLIAYFMPEGVAIADLRTFLATRLPAYMLPTGWVGLAQLPLTPNGKVDRRALMQESPTIAVRAILPPRTAAEELLAGIWANLLQQNQISRTDNFFELGGHSLLATQLIAQIRQTFERELPLRSVFETPTLAALAEAIATSETHSSPPIIPIADQSQAPLSFAQQRFWVLAQLDPDSPSYNIPLAIRLRGRLDLRLLRQSFETVIQRHVVLRTAFTTVAGHPLPVISPTATLTIPVIDVSTIAPDQQTPLLAAIAQTEAARSFDLTTPQLLRVTVIHVQSNEYLILITLHHIVADAWSMNLLVQEVVSKYAGLQQGQLKAPADLPIQYADFAHWQRQWLQGDRLEQSLDYWQQQLGGMPALLDLPTDRPRPAVQQFRGAVQRFQLDADLTAQLRQLSQRSRSTLFMTLLLGLNLLLHRYSGSEDIAIGSPIANRPRAELESLIGCFANTLVFRTNLSGNPTVMELLERIRTTAMAAYAHQDAPFEQVIEAVQPERSLSYAPLFQVMLVLQNLPLSELTTPEMQWEWFESDSGTAKFDLTWMLTETPSGLAVRLEYDTALFDATTIARFAHHFETLLRSMVANPDCPIATLPLLSEPELQQILWDWNQTQRDYPTGFCLHDLFAAQVERTPAAIAVIDADQALTYEALNAQANQLAHHLQSLGISPDTPVGLCLERSSHLLVAILGILKAGGAYVPLDPAYPSDRLAFMIQDSAAPIVITQRSLASRLTPITTAIADNDPSGDRPHSLAPTSVIEETQPDQSPSPKAGEGFRVRAATLPPPTIVCLDAEPLLTTYPTTNPITNTIAEHLAYIIYTSGSTGIPKGVAIAHRSPVALVQWAQETYTPHQLQGVLAATSVCFDLSVFEIFVPLCSGGTVILANTVLDLVELPAAHQITLINTVPSAMRELLRLQALPPNAHTVNLAGEALSATLVQQLYQQPQIETVLNLYGPSEDTTYSTMLQVPRSEVSPSIGRPIANTQAYILDHALQPVPIGVVGELYLSGTGLARGYWQRPDLTAERFIPHPKSLSLGRGTLNDLPSPIGRGAGGEGRLYKTGDRARYRANGEIEFLGRLDHQVKVRGFRVELGEIEATLERHPAIAQVVVMMRVDTSDTSDHAQLVAYWVPTAEDDATLEPEQLRQFLAAQLPAYLIPAHFVRLLYLPLTPNGKLDRAALPAPDLQPITTESTTQPQTVMEQQLVEIWQTVLGRSPIGTQDNFFALGGDSILAIQAIAQANQIGIRLTPRQMFQAQTIAQLTTLADTTPAIVAEQGMITGNVPLTPIQQWFFEQPLQNPHHWNQSVLLTVRTPLQPTLLRLALHALLQHHDALRSQFHQTAEGWQQTQFAPRDTVPLIHSDLSQLGDTEAAKTISAIANELQASLNLATGELMRVAYFDRGNPAGGDRLLIVVHHLVIDGVSWRILLEGLQQAYTQLSQQQPLHLPAKTTAFKTWAEQLDQMFPDLQPAIAYWTADHWQTIPPFPIDHPQGSNRIADMDCVSICLSDAETQALLQEAPAAYRTQILDLLLTALALTLQPWTGDRALVVELEGHGRTENAGTIDLSRTIGWFTSLFPVWLDLAAITDFASAIKSIKEQLRQVPDQGMTYGILRYGTDPALQAKLRSLPPAAVRFNYLGQVDNVFSDGFSPAPEFGGYARSLQDQRDIPLEINSLVLHNQLRLDWLYSRSHYNQGTIQALADTYLDTVRSLIQHCVNPEAVGFTPSDFPQMELSQAELDDLLADL